MVKVEVNDVVVSDPDTEVIVATPVPAAVDKDFTVHNKGGPIEAKAWAKHDDNDWDEVAAAAIDTGGSVNLKVDRNAHTQVKLTATPVDPTVPGNVDAVLEWVEDPDN